MLKKLAWGKFKLQYSGKTTKTVNAVIKITDIPKPLYRQKSIINNETD